MTNTKRQITHADIDDAMKGIINQTVSNRPFMCDGSPLNCDVLVIGYNPSTSTPFTPFWTVTNGCDKEGWLKEYAKKNNINMKPTRKRLEILSKNIQSVGNGKHKLLEANLYPYGAPSKAKLPKGLHDTKWIKYLLDTLDYKAIIALGDDIGYFLNGYFEITLTRDELCKTQKEGKAISIYQTFNHFAGRQGMTDYYVSGLAGKLELD